MSSAQFDPCRQWLGIDAVELGDPRRVLGLLPSEADPLVVLRAADARLTLLRSIAPGPFDMARQALIKRVEESREAVLTQIATAPHPPLPIGAAFTMPPAPAATGVSQPPPLPMVPWESQSDDGFVAVKKSPASRNRSSGSGGLLLLIALLLAAAGGLVWVWKDDPSVKDALATISSGAKQPTIRKFGDPDPPPEQEPEPRPQPAPASPPDPEPQREVTVESTVAPEEPAAPESAAEATNDAADAEAIVPFLKKTLAALQDGQFDEADDALGQAGDEAIGRAAADRLAQWQALVTYAKGFADLRERALDAARPGLEYEIDGRVVAIVEMDEGKIIYRYAGKNKTLPRSKIPDKLMLAILEKWLTRKPANHLFLGAYHATKPGPDLEKARGAWQLAQRGGADASDLLPLLDDPVLVKAARNRQ
jgi:hypothetical protein